MRLGEHQPLAIGRDLREKVAPSVERGALDRLGRPAPPAVERDPKQVESELLAALLRFPQELLTAQDLRGFLHAQEYVVLGALGLQLSGAAAREIDVLAVRAPGGVGLDIGLVVGAGQRRDRAGLAVVIREDAHHREEDLREQDVLSG